MRRAKRLAKPAYRTGEVQQEMFVEDTLDRASREALVT